MALNFINTKDAATDGIKVLVYGGAGAGKTYLARTLPHRETFIVSAEAGLLSLADVEIAGAKIETMEDMNDIYQWIVSSEEAERYKWLAIDSISEVAEAVLSDEKKKASDPRQAYGKLIEVVGDLVRAFRDMPNRSIYMAAKLERIRDDLTGSMLYGPMMPGTKLGPALSYYFDEVFALRMGPVDPDTGVAQRALLTASDTQYVAKDRSGKLGQWEPPDLGHCAAKIRGERVAVAAPPVEPPPPAELPPPVTDEHGDEVPDDPPPEQSVKESLETAA